MKNQKEFTYLIRGRPGFYKIGKSIDPNKRVKIIKTANPEAVLVAYGKGISEKDLHDIYDKFRINLEWFKLRPKEISKIIKILNNEYEGVKPKPLYIQFGKYHSVRLQDMTSPKQINYMRWFIKNGSGKNSEWKKHFKNQLKRCNSWNKKLGHFI